MTSPTRPRVLILDDEPEVIALLAKSFGSLPFDAVFCASGVEALITIFEGYQAEQAFDALVLDCALPHFDGFTIARIVRMAEATGISKRAKIGYFTAFAKTVEQSTLLEEVGAQAYWRKPEDMTELPALISAWLRVSE